MRVTALLMMLTAASVMDTAFATKGGEKNDPRMYALKRSKNLSEDEELKVPKGCTTFKIVRFNEEKRFVDTGEDPVIGDSFSYPFYDAEDSSVKLGYYVDSSVYTTPNEFSDEPENAFAGIYTTGTFNFDYDPDPEFPGYRSQILVQGYLNSGSGMIAISGGLGEYGRASGNVFVNIHLLSEETGEEVGDGLQFIVCNACS
jgi:hypothetical protein